MSLSFIFLVVFLESICYSTTAAGSVTCQLSSPELPDCVCASGSSGPIGGPCQPCTLGYFCVGGGTSLPQLCPVGTYGDVEGLSACIPCLQGTVQTGIGMQASSQCISCMAGTYQTGLGIATLSRCLQCMKGTYQTGVGMSSPSQCLQCTPGTYQPVLGLAFEAGCTACLQGKFQTGYGITTSSACNHCLSGTFQSSPDGFANCSLCAAGTYHTGLGSTTASDCTLCGLGTFTTASGASSNKTCIPCATGTYHTGSGNPTDTCSSCGAGTYQTATGATSRFQCIQCSSGSYQTGLGASTPKDCKSCPPGTYLPFPGAVSSTSCTRCGAGRYQTGYAATVSSNCTRCPVGTYQTSTGMSSLLQCISCSAGTYQSINGATTSASCMACDPGKYQSAEAASTSLQCISCPSGSYQSIRGATNLTDCKLCSPGEYQPNLAAMTSAQCQLCNSGTFSTAWGAGSSSQCTQCLAGSYSTGVGIPVSTQCIPCEAGTVQVGLARQDHSDCRPCIPGTYQTGQGMGGVGNCLTCPEGTYQTGLGMTMIQECTQCPQGSYQQKRGMHDEISCLACPSGTYQTGTGIPSSGQCTLCDRGTFQSSDAGVTACTLCGQGTYQPDKGVISVSQCIPCPKGTYQTGDGMGNLSHCLLCFPGTYQPVQGQISSEACVACHMGTYQTEHGSIAKCRPCMEGTYQTSTGVSSSAGCTPCGIGMFSTGTGLTVNVCSSCLMGTYTNATGTKQCRMCDEGKYQSQPGQSTCSDCTYGTYQPFSGVKFDSWCVECDAGKYQSMLGASTEASCKPCAKGMHGPSRGQSACVACIPGLYQNTESSPVCFSCMSGSYSSQSAATACTPCQTGMYMNKTGQPQCQSCEPGFFQYLTGASYCFSCQRGEFQPNTSSTKCRLCTRGTFQDQINASACLACEAGLYALNTGSTQCSPCPSGYFQSGLNSTGCNICPSGSFQPIKGQSSCMGCPLGNYQSAPGRTSCTPCTAGQFQNQSGSIRCSPCKRGTYHTQTGQTNASDCLNCKPGTYASSTGATVCNSCIPGQYSSDAGQSLCSMCPPGLFQSHFGKDSCTPCPNGTFSAASGMIQLDQCKKCAKGSYANTTGSTVCNPCPPGTFQHLQGMSQCRICAAGTYMNLSGWGTTCILCGPGTFSSVLGAVSESSCTLCRDGYFSQRSGQISPATCSMCQLGKVSTDLKAECRVCSQGTLCPPGYHQPIICVPELMCNGTSIRALDGFLPLLRDNCTAAIPCPVGTRCQEGVVPAGYNDTHFVVFENGPRITQSSCPGFVLSYGYKRMDPPYILQVPQTLFRLLPKKCPAGSYLLEDCVQCNPGMYSSSVGALNSSTCQQCLMGTYSSNAGATNCTLALPGEFVDTEGASSSPHLCQPGTYQTAFQSTTCLTCSAGTYTSDSGKSICLECAAGTAQALTGSTNCNQCDVSHFSSPGDAVCSWCDSIPTLLDPAHNCDTPRLPANLTSIWLTVQGDSQDDCIGMGPSKLLTEGNTTDSLVIPVQALTGDTLCVHTMKFLGRPELTRTWTMPSKLLLRPVLLRVFPHNDTFYPALCAQKGFGVVFTVEDQMGETRTDLSGARAVISMLDPSGQNLLFWMACNRLPKDPNEKIPVGTCHVAFCPTMRVMIKVTLSWPDGAVEGTALVSPGPTSFCPPTNTWLATAELVTPSVPYFPGDSVEIRVRSINSPDTSLAVFKFAIKILPGLSFVSFSSVYSAIYQMGDDDILSVMGDSVSSQTSGGDILGVVTLKLDASFSGVIMLAQIVPSTFQFTLDNTVSYVMPVRTLGFSCRSDGYIDLLTDVQRVTSLIASPRRKLLVNWKTLQTAANLYPTSIDVVGVTNVVKIYTLLSNALCSSLSPRNLFVQSCTSILPAGISNVSQAATVRVYFQGVSTLVNITVAAPTNPVVKWVQATTGLAGRFKIYARLWTGKKDIIPQVILDVDATPFLGTIPGQGVAVTSDQWTCIKTGVNFTVGSPPLFSGLCASPKTSYQPGSLFVFTGGQAGGSMGVFTFYSSQLSFDHTQGSILIFGRGDAQGGLLIPNTVFQATSASLTTRVTLTGQTLTLRNYGASARCVLLSPVSFPLFTTGLVPIFPPAPTSLRISLSSQTLVTQQDLTGLIPSSTFVTQATLFFSDGTNTGVLMDPRLQLSTNDALDIAGLGVMSRTMQGDAIITFRIQGMDCISTSLTVKILPSSVITATIICPTCPTQLTLREDPLSQQFPELYLSTLSATAFIVRRSLVDGKTLDRYENITVGPTGGLVGGVLFGLQSGALSISTRFTSQPFSLPILDRLAVSWTLWCNSKPCAGLKLSAPGDGASFPPFSYTTSLTLTLSLTLANGTVLYSPWVRGVSCYANDTKIPTTQTGCDIRLAYGPLTVNAVFAPEWKIPPSSLGASSNGHSLFVHRLENLMLTGPSLLYQLHCSLIWEHANYITTGILTDGNAGLVQGVFRATPPLVVRETSGVIGADWRGVGQLVASFTGKEIMMQVSATISSLYFNSVSIDFLPLQWATAHNTPFTLLPVLSPSLLSGPVTPLALNNLSSRVLKWSSSAPQVIDIEAQQGIMTLLSDYYKALTITANLISCEKFPGSTTSQDITVNVVPSLPGEIDFGEEERGIPLRSYAVGETITIPIYLYATTSLQSYILEVYLPPAAVEVLDCTGGILPNSQCGVVNRDGVTFFRSVGAFTASRLMGRLLIANVQGVVLLNTLASMRVRLVQAVMESSIVTGQEYTYTIQLGSPMDSAHVTTTRRILSQPYEPQGLVYGDTDGDGSFTSADVLFLEHYIVISVFKNPPPICLPQVECQTISQLTNWQIMQLKPVRNPGIPATKPDGTDVLFLLRALAGKVFFLASLESETRPGVIQILFRLCDYSQDCSPSNAAASVQLTAPANPNMAFNSQSSYDPSDGTITVDCQRTEMGEFEVSTLATTVTFDESLVGFRIITQSLDQLASPDSSLAMDRNFIFTPLKPLGFLNILASENSFIEELPSVEYLPTTNCQYLCDDSSLFLDTSLGSPAWINNSALSVGFALSVAPMMQGYWPVFQPPGVTVPAAIQITRLPNPVSNANAVWVGDTFNVTVTPPAGSSMAVFRIQTTCPFVSVNGGEILNNMLLVNTMQHPVAFLVFTATNPGDQVVTITPVDSFPTSGLLSLSPLQTLIPAFSPLIVRIDMQPQCTGVILWSKLGGTRDEACNVLLTPIWAPPSPSSQPVTMICQTYPCVLQAFGQLLRPVIPMYIPFQPRIVIQKPVISLGQRTQWRVMCALSSLDEKLTVTVNQRALSAGMIKTQPANALIITRGHILGAKLGTAVVSFAGVVTRINVTDTINPPRTLRGFAFTGIDFTLASSEKRITANFISGTILAGQKAYLFLQASYSGGYTLLLDPKPRTDNITVINASSDIVVSQLDGSITVKPGALGGPERPVVSVEYRGVLLNISATIIPLHPDSLYVCCDIAVASPSSKLFGLANYPSQIPLQNLSVTFQGQSEPTSLSLLDPRIHLAFDPLVLDFSPDLLTWTVKSGPVSTTASVITVTYSQPSSLVTLQTQLQITLMDGTALEILPEVFRLRRVHCSSTVFETSQPLQAMFVSTNGKRVPVPDAELILSSSNPLVATVKMNPSSVTGVQVGSTSITVKARGFTAICQVEVLHQSILFENIDIVSPKASIKGVKDTLIPVLIAGTLEGGQRVKDISFLSPVLSVSGPLSIRDLSLIILGNSYPLNPGVLQVDLQACPNPGPTNLTTQEKLEVCLTPVITSTQPADVVLRLNPSVTQEGGPPESVSVILIAGGILSFYIQIQTDQFQITCVAGADLPVFADCTPNAPTQGGIIVAGAWGVPLDLRIVELELVIIKPVPASAWGFVEVYRGMSVARVPIVAGQFGFTTTTGSTGMINPVTTLMPSLPLVDSSVLLRKYREVFRWPAVSQSVRNALYNLLLLVYKQRNVDPRLYSNEFELSAMFQVTDRFLQPDTNYTSLVVNFHTDQLPPILGSVYIPEQKILQVPATHIQDGWYVVEWRQKIPVLSLDISFSVTTSFTDIAWPWEIASPLSTGLALPDCPRSAKDTGTFLATYYLTGNLTQALIDHIACHIKVAARRIMVSNPTPDGKIALSISLESLERVHQANLLIMSDWFSSQLGSPQSGLLSLSDNATDSYSSTTNQTQEILSRVERAGITYINDTSDPPTPCPSGFYFSKNGSYARLPPHGYAGADCYDMLCVEGYTVIEESASTPPRCIPTPVTQDIVWVCMSVIFSLITVVAVGIFCIHAVIWKPTSEDVLIFDTDPCKSTENLPVQPLPFSDNDDDDGRHVVTGIHLDSVSVTTIMH